MDSTRRGFLSAGAFAGVGAGLGVAGDRLTAGDGARRSADRAMVEFYGGHQAGIATRSQEHLQFAAFDLVSDALIDLRGLLERWSAAAALLVQGRPVGALATGNAPPVDTGEAVGLEPSSVTITFGLGPGVFVRGGRDRLGLAALRPAALAELPAFPGEALESAVCGGDLGVQVCADDPQVAFHAVNSLIRLAGSVAVPRWLLAGFGRTSNSRSQLTPRNLMGFKDWTANIMVENERALDRFVWADGSGSSDWMRGGSYMVVRRIRMLLGAWDATGLSDQEATFGRQKLSGAPLGGLHEHDAIDLTSRVGGVPVIAKDAHIRLASPSYHGGERILRRGYSFVDGIDPATDSAAGGLLFICYQRDPRLQFIPIQRRLASADALNRHILHIGSATFACPPGATRGGFVGEALFA